MPRNTSQTMPRGQPRVNWLFGCGHPVFGPQGWRMDTALCCLPVWMVPFPIALSLRSSVSPICFFALLPMCAVQHLVWRVWSGRWDYLQGRCCDSLQPLLQRRGRRHAGRAISVMSVRFWAPLLPVSLEAGQHLGEALGFCHHTLVTVGILGNEIWSEPYKFIKLCSFKSFSPTAGSKPWGGRLFLDTFTPAKRFTCPGKALYHSEHGERRKQAAWGGFCAVGSG